MAVRLINETKSSGTIGGKRMTTLPTGLRLKIGGVRLAEGEFPTPPDSSVCLESHSMSEYVSPTSPEVWDKWVTEQLMPWYKRVLGVMGVSQTFSHVRRLTPSYEYIHEFKFRYRGQEYSGLIIIKGLNLLPPTIITASYYGG